MPELGDEFGSFFEAAATLALLFIIIGWVSSKLVGLAQTALNSHGKMLRRELARCFGGDEAGPFTRYFYWHPLVESLSQPPTLRRLRRWLPQMPSLSRSPAGYPDGRLPVHIAPETFAAAMLNPFPWPTTRRALALVLAGNPPEPEDITRDPSDEQSTLAGMLASSRERVEGEGTWEDLLGDHASRYDRVFREGPVNIHFAAPAGRNLLAGLRHSWRANRLVPAAARSRIMAVLDDSEGDLEQLRESLGRWYSEMMDRVTGRFKRRALAALFAVAFLICFLFNVDSIHIFESITGRTPSGSSEAASGSTVSRSDGARFNLAYQKHCSTGLDESCSHELLAALWRDAKSSNLIRVLADAQPYGPVQVSDRIEQLRHVRNWCRSEKRAELCGDGLILEIEFCIAGALPPISSGAQPQPLDRDQHEQRCGAAWRGLWSSPALFWDPAAASALADRAFRGGTRDPSRAVAGTRELADEATAVGPPPDSALPGVSVLFFGRPEILPGGLAGLLGILLSALLATLGAPFWYDLLGRLSRRGTSGSKS